MYDDNTGSGGRGGSYPTMLSCVQAAAEKETQKPWFWEQVLGHRCVPKIASPEARTKIERNRIEIQPKTNNTQK